MSNQSKLFQLIQLEFLQKNYLEYALETRSSFEDFKEHYFQNYFITDSTFRRLKQEWADGILKDRSAFSEFHPIYPCYHFKAGWIHAKASSLGVSLTKQESKELIKEFDNI